MRLKEKLEREIGMIIRARPKYLEGIDIFGNWSTGNDSEFFFNSGRAALKFFLEWLSRKKNREIVIGMQAFNCKVVLDAALESYCKVVLTDISLQSFSVTFNSVKKMVKQKKIDVLLLTHYQGIPNQEYENIVDLCRRNQVWVVEDLSQTYGSKINGIEVGSLGDVKLYSYAFDKPLTCMYGGCLRFNTEACQSFKSLFEKLPVESNKEALLHLKVLSFLWKYTDSEVYGEGIDNYKVIAFLKGNRFNDSCVYFVLSNALIRRIVSKVLRLITKLNFSERIIVKQLHPMKIGLVRRQAENYLYDPKKIEPFAKICNDHLVVYPQFNNSVINWNRFSFLDESSVLKNELSDKGYQVSNFNWPVTLNKVSKSNSVTILDDVVKSELASKNILNVPVWK